MYEKEMKSPTNAEIFIKPIHWHISTLFIPTLKKNCKNACKFKNNAYLCTRVRETPSQHDKGWPVRLSVRTQDFHS